MYKGLKKLTLFFLIMFLCSYITYSIEPGEPAPADESLPVPESLEEAAPSPVPGLQEAEQPDEAQQQAASDFNKKVEEIIIKGINSYYKNGGKGTIGIYIKELNTGFEYAFNGEKNKSGQSG